MSKNHVELLVCPVSSPHQFDEFSTEQLHKRIIHIGDIRSANEIFVYPQPGNYEAGQLPATMIHVEAGNEYNRLWFITSTLYEDLKNVLIPQD